MRPFKGRKASAVYPTLIALAGLLALMACWLILLDKSSTFEARVGETQFELISQYQDGEDYLFYMDQAAGRSADRAIMALASGGGYSGGSDCGSVGDYTLWNSGGRECYPTQSGLRGSFELEFNIALNEYSHLSYLPEGNITQYTLVYSDEDALSFVARPERYTDFITKLMDRGSELPPGATTAKEGRKKISVHYVELGEAIDYSALASQGGK